MTKDGDGIARPDLRGLDSGDAVAQRLQGGSLAVGDAVIDLDQRDGWEQGALGKAAGQLEADDRGRGGSRRCAGSGTWEQSPQGQLGAGRHAVAGCVAGDG